MVAGLGVMIGLVVARGVGVDPGLLVAAVIGAAGAVGAVALTRARPGKLLLQYLAVANVFFVGTFLLTSPTARLLEGPPGSTSGLLGLVNIPDLDGPVVVVILDELPLTTLLRDDGSLNDERFPNFARLADRSTWFRNASAHISSTHMAVPTLLTGRNALGSQLPTWRDHPRNLLTMFGTEVPVERYEVVTDLCPPTMCEPPPGEPLSQAVKDTVVVFGHRVLPEQLRGHLPAIDNAWGGFGGEVAGGETDSSGKPADNSAKAFERWHGLDADERSAPGQAAELIERGTAIGDDPSLHLIHVALPHNPWVLSPTGSRLREEVKRVEDPADPAFERSVQLQYQLQSMQLGGADAALGQVLDHFDEAGLWDDATLVVTSDHGTSLLPPDFGRGPTENNLQELFRIPMFIHAPGQGSGAIEDAPAQTIDLVPSLVDLLGIDTDWTFEGHSLFDGSEPTTEPRVGTDFSPALDVVRRHHEGMGEGWDWTALAAVGEHRALVGRPLDDFEIGAPSRLRWEIDHAADLEDLPTDEGYAPQVLTGRVEGRDGERPPELVVSVNGTIGGELGGYQADGSRWWFASLLGPYLVKGANDVRAFEVEGTGDDVVLHPLE
jgi:hypothetical protein